MSDKSPFSLSSGALEIEQLAIAGLLDLRVRHAWPALLQAWSEAAGATWPETPNTVAMGRVGIFWVAPAEWLIACDDPGGWEERLTQACRGYTHHIADVTAGHMLLRVAGSAARDFLAKGCSLDLHPRAFGGNRCAQTLLAQIPVLVRNHSAAPEFHLYADVSYAAYLWAWCADAAVEFG